jgi:hypothetical protein
VAEERSWYDRYAEYLGCTPEEVRQAERAVHLAVAAAEGRDEFHKWAFPRVTAAAVNVLPDASALRACYRAGTVSRRLMEKMFTPDYLADLKVLMGDV